MKKIMLAMAVIATMAAFASCNKTCNCTQKVSYIDETGEWSDMGEMGGTSTFTQQTKGKCSSLNAETRQNMGGMTMVSTVECQ